MSVFDPLSYQSIGRSIIQALQEQPVNNLETLEPFDGAGVYMLYYTGDFAPYDPLAVRNRLEPGSWPIYIGKAEISKSRKGVSVPSEQEMGDKLFKRIREHRRSIELAENLSPGHFQVRYLSVAPTWVPMAETIALEVHKPLWNVVVDGLGNHAPGSGRSAMKRPRWDTLHPGREWASRFGEDNETHDSILNKVAAHLEQGPRELRFSF